MNKKLLLLGVIFGIFVISISFIFLSSKKVNQTSTSNKEVIVEDIAVNRKARFLIFTNGTKRIFTDSKYHNKSEDVYIEGTDPGIINVKKSGITWRDFFSTLPMSLSQECLITGTGQRFCTGETGFLAFYINGQKTEGVLDKEIMDQDELLVSFGTQNEEEIKNQLSEL